MKLKKKKQERFIEEKKSKRDENKRYELGWKLIETGKSKKWKRNYFEMRKIIEWNQINNKKLLIYNNLVSEIFLEKVCNVYFQVVMNINWSSFL